jgi:hypothetical protein
MLKEHEEFSAHLLKSFLQEPGKEVTYTPGADPPDMDFYVNGGKWAVEHTQLHLYTERDGYEISRKGIDSLIKTFSDRLKKKLREELECKWILAVKGPNSSADLLKVENAVAETIISERKINHTISNELYDLIMIPGEKPGIEIFSTLGPKSKVPKINISTSTIQEVINYSINRILKSKLPKFGKMVGYNKLVLLIESQYSYVTLDNVKRALSNHPELNALLSMVYLIHHGEVYLLAEADETL